MEQGKSNTMNKKDCTIQTIVLLLLAVGLLLMPERAAIAGDDNFAGWYNSDKWDVAGDAVLNSDNMRRLAGQAGAADSR